MANPQHEDGLADPVTVFRWLTDIVDLYAPNPAYLKVAGRPVVTVRGTAHVTVQLEGGREPAARERPRRAAHRRGYQCHAARALDGLFYYASNEYQGDQIFDFDRTQSLSVRTYHLLPDDTGKRRIWVATVSPGYDDRQLKDGRVPRTADRDNGRYYDRQWQSAIDMRADWVVVTSWNEWMENTQIEPSVRYGELYARLDKDVGRSLQTQNRQPLRGTADQGLRTRDIAGIRTPSGPDCAGESNSLSVLFWPQRTSVPTPRCGENQRRQDTCIPGVASLAEIRAPTGGRRRSTD